MSEHLKGGNADPASSLDPAYWGEVDTERDPIRVLPMTTRTGSTPHDVRAVFAHAGAQVILGKSIHANAVGDESSKDPLKPFIRRLEELLRNPSDLHQVDILLVHRGGGVNPTPQNPRWTPTNVPDARRKRFLELCVDVRDLGVEVVVALGHANVSVLDWEAREDVCLPLGIFEATTPTAAAAWILQEHINPRLVDTALIYSQELAT
ncbi:hypothetical protein [Microbacterium gorillae]|uniref:hypothetical protein n=1 Tax=Microbacterium gorillae TaxID=1231063 RepID=UPI003D9616A6